MAHRTNEDNQRDSKEEKEVYKSMKNNKEKRYRVGYNIVGYKECFIMAKNKKEIELKKRIKELELINESHKNLNCGLRIELNKYKEEERIRQRNKKEWERITKL
jgi:hypothetical protein